LGEKLVYGLEVLQGYQKTLDPKIYIHLKERRVEITKGIYEGGRRRCAM
jgi:hypothetical protein